MNMYQKREQRKNNKLEDNKSLQSTSINWYPGHMAKAKRQIMESICSVDIVLEVVDARIPFSSHIKEMDSFLDKKKIILVFNKYDLCDKKETLKFINYYNNLGYICITCDSKNSSDYKKIISKIDNIMQETNNKRKQKGLLPKKAKAIVIGVPNVGKSTLINKFLGKTINKVSNKPGVTRNISLLKLNKDVDLIDTPGILWPKIETQQQALNLGAFSVIKEEILPEDKVAIHILSKLNKYYKEILKSEFNIDDFDEKDLISMYEIINNFKRFPLYQGEVDYDRVNIYIMNLIKSEKINNITFDRLI